MLLLYGLPSKEERYFAHLKKSRSLSRRRQSSFMPRVRLLALVSGQRNGSPRRVWTYVKGGGVAHGTATSYGLHKTGYNESWVPRRAAPSLPAITPAFVPGIVQLFSRYQGLTLVKPRRHPEHYTYYFNPAHFTVLAEHHTIFCLNTSVNALSTWHTSDSIATNAGLSPSWPRPRYSCIPRISTCFVVHLDLICCKQAR